MNQDIRKLKKLVNETGLGFLFKKISFEYIGDNDEIVIVIFKRNKIPMTTAEKTRWDDKIADLLKESGFELFEVRN